VDECKPLVVGVRVGLLPGCDEPTINPTMEQMKTSRLDLVLAGTAAGAYTRPLFSST